MISDKRRREKNKVEKNLIKYSQPGGCFWFFSDIFFILILNCFAKMNDYLLCSFCNLSLRSQNIFSKNCVEAPLPKIYPGSPDPTSQTPWSV